MRARRNLVPTGARRTFQRSTVFDRSPKYAWIAKQLLEPERAIQFRVAWLDDNGNRHVPDLHNVSDAMPTFAAFSDSCFTVRITAVAACRWTLESQHVSFRNPRNMWGNPVCLVCRLWLVCEAVRR